MNIDLLVMVIILYIFKNNSRQYWHAKNKNQNLLLLLLFINERNQCLNNKYYMNYPNHPLENSNFIKNISKDTSINNTEDNIINNDKDDAISKNNDPSIDTNKDITKNNSKATSINNIEDNVIYNNKCETINKNNVSSIDTNKNITKNTTNNNIVNKDNDTNKDNPINNNKNNSKATSINNIEDDIINNDKSDAISKSNDSSIDTNKNNNNEDTTINNNKNSNEAILKNKFIKAATKINDKPLTYKNPYKKDYKININNTFKQLPLAKEIIDINNFTNHFNIKTQVPLTDVKGKVPVLVSSTNITEVFHGRVTFVKPIISILKVTNEIFITSKSILPTLNFNNNNAVLHYEGFLKTRLEYLEDVIIEHSQIKCDSKHYIMFIPFSGSKELNISDESINSSNIVLQDFTLDINKSTFSVDTFLEKPSKGNKYINLYKICNLTVKVNCDVSLYRKKLVQL